MGATFLKKGSETEKKGAINMTFLGVRFAPVFDISHFFFYSTHERIIMTLD